MYDILFFKLPQAGGHWTGLKRRVFGVAERSRTKAKNSTFLWRINLTADTVLAPSIAGTRCDQTPGPQGERGKGKKRPRVMVSESW